MPKPPPIHYPIPGDINPPDGDCMTIVIPDAPEFRQMLVGQLVELTRWWVYDRDPLKRGKYVAARWQRNIQDAIDSIGVCGMNIVSVDCQHVPYDDPRCAEFDPATGVLTLFIPAGAPGPVGPPGVDGGDGLVINVNVFHLTQGTTEDKRTKVFSGAMYLVTYLEEKIYEFYEAINATTSTLRAAAALTETIPLLSVLPIEEIASTADEIAEFELAEFAANSTEELRQELACKLFCKVVSDGYLCSQDTLTAWVVEMVAQSIPGTARWQYGVMGTLWPKDELLRRFWIGSNDGNADWSLVCDQCQDVVFQRFSGFGADGVTVTKGTYNPALDIVVGAYDGIATVFDEFTVDFNPVVVERVEIHSINGVGASCGGGPTRTKTLRLYRSGNVVYEAQWTDAQDCVWKVVSDIGIVADRLYIDWRRSTSGPLINIDGLRVAGFEGTP